MLYIFADTILSSPLEKMLEQFTASFTDITVVQLDNMPQLRHGDHVLFAWHADPFTGESEDMLRFLSAAATLSPTYFEGTIGAILCSSDSFLYTKSFASKLAFMSNTMGLTFMGKPLVEALHHYENFLNKQKLFPLSLMEICMQEARLLGQRLSESVLPMSIQNARITAVHTSDPRRSNTYAAMDAALNLIPGTKKIFSLHGENIMDCRGCEHNTCMRFSAKGTCYYHKDILKDVFEGLIESDALMIACPNYNDSMPANYFALVNRLTYIYRSLDLTKKSIYAIIVSSNSGSDMVAAQIISAFCFNKGFQLPAYFALMNQASDPLSILELPNFHQVISDYVARISLEV